MTGFVLKAATAWNGQPPAFVQRLAEQADESGLGATASAIGYGKTAVSLVIANRYGAGLDRLEAAVTAAFAAAEDCPVLGEIDAERCRRERETAARAHNLLAGLLRNACRACPRRDA